MKKKFFFAAVALVMSAATTVGYKAYDKSNMSEFMMANIEALSSPEDNSFICQNCYSGGPGASSCSIEAGIDIVGSGMSGSCSVSCNQGYYACCSIRCICCKE